MSKRRANGEGNIRKRKDGRWEGRYTAGYDTNGKPIAKNVLGKTQAEVRQKLRQAIDDSKGLDMQAYGKYTLGQWMDIWFENYAEIKVRASSHQTYKGYIENHIKPHLGSIPLEKLTSLDLQKFYRYLYTEGRLQRVESRNQPKGLSAKTVRNINQIISSALELAKEQKLILTNPTSACSLPKVEHTEMKTIPEEDLAKFFTEAKASGVYEMYYIELATGLRRGELLGLKWSDIDFGKQVIHVHRQVQRVKGEVIEAPLKTKNSYRNVSISKDAVDILKELKKNNPSCYVFPSPNGGPISPDSVEHMLHRVLERAGLERVRFHDLRHTFATIALQNGVDIKTVSSMLGHFSAGFTLDTYAHVTTTAQKDAADKMGAILAV